MRVEVLSPTNFRDMKFDAGASEPESSATPTNTQLPYLSTELSLIHHCKRLIWHLLVRHLRLSAKGLHEGIFHGTIHRVFFTTHADS